MTAEAFIYDAVRTPRDKGKARTCLDELENSQQRFGLITLCAGGGMGITTIIERI